MARPQLTASSRWTRLSFWAVSYIVLCGTLFQVVSAGGQSTPEVQPSGWGMSLRLVYHELMIGLILVATAIDWDGYIIPDQITMPGMLIGCLGAFAFGELQLIHLWVDWSVAIPQISGPYIPAWFDPHRHWHGLAWSLAGLGMGAGLTWLVRASSSWLMGRETLGFGDVTFMAMAGSFLGWQPTVCAFLIAPLLGLLVGVPLKWMTNKSYIPFGPFLGGGVLVVLFGWGPIWFRSRGIFGDWFGLLILAGLASVGFVMLIGLLLLYRNIPGRNAG